LNKQIENLQSDIDNKNQDYQDLDAKLTQQVFFFFFFWKKGKKKIFFYKNNHLFLSRKKLLLSSSKNWNPHKVYIPNNLKNLLHFKKNYNK